MRRPGLRTGWIFLGFGVLSCQGDRAAGPEAEGVVPTLASLPNTRVLIDDGRPLMAALFDKDSIAHDIVLGSVTLDGRVGAEVVLKLDGAADLLAALGSEAGVIVSAEGRESRFKFSGLATGLTVYRFATAGSVALEFRLPRAVAEVRESKVLLELRSNAAIVSSNTPWITAGGFTSSDSVAASHGPDCPIQVTSGSCGPINYTVVPSVPAHPIIGGTFQSTTGNGPSSTIRLTFSFPISEITTEIRDPTWSGNRMVGFDGSGAQIGSVDFAFNSTPGTNAPDIKTLTGEFWRVDLVPAANDYVAYSATVKQGHQQVRVTCSPTSLQRGATVNCQIQMLIPEAFTVVSRIAKAAGFTVSDSPNSSHPAAGVNNWQGTAVTTTDVTVVVTAGGTSYTNSTAARFTVQPRSWAPWQLTTPIQSVLIHGRMTPYPVPGSSVWGQFTPALPDTASFVISRPTQGPNKDIAFVGARPDLDAYHVNTHPALEPVPGNLKPGNPNYRAWHEWHDDQNQQPSGTCRKQDVSTLRTNVRRHEGIPIVSNSHAGIANSQLATFQPQNDIERLFTMRTDDQLKNQIAAAILNFFNSPSGSYQQQRRQFDAVDTPLVASQGINCNFDYQRGAP